MDRATPEGRATENGIHRRAGTMTVTEIIGTFGITVGIGTEIGTGTATDTTEETGTTITIENDSTAETVLTAGPRPTKSADDYLRRACACVGQNSTDLRLYLDKTKERSSNEPSRF